MSFNIADFLKSLLPPGLPKSEGDAEPLRVQNQAMEPLQPPPMPPIFSTNDAFSVNWKSDWDHTQNTETENWSHQSGQEWNVPPPMQESWLEQPPPVLSVDTPESPPLYEKKGVHQPVEYDDSLPTVCITTVYVFKHFKSILFMF